MTGSATFRARDWAIAICLAVFLTCGVTTAKANGSDMQGSNDLDVALVQQMRSESNAELVDYHQVDEHKNDIQHPIAPVAESDLQSRDASFNMPLAGGFADMVVTAKNDSPASSACVRVVVAVPSAFGGYLHWEEGDLLWMKLKADNWGDARRVDGVEINGVKYDLFAFDYKHVLAPGAATETPVITGFYLDERIDIEGGAFVYVGSGGSVCRLNVTEASVMVGLQACTPLSDGSATVAPTDGATGTPGYSATEAPDEDATETATESGLTLAERSLAAGLGALSATNHPWA